MLSKIKTRGQPTKYISLSLFVLWAAVCLMRILRQYEEQHRDARSETHVHDACCRIGDNAACTSFPTCEASAIGAIPCCVFEGVYSVAEAIHSYLHRIPRVSADKINAPRRNTAYTDSKSRSRDILIQYQHPVEIRLDDTDGAADTAFL